MLWPVPLRPAGARRDGVRVRLPARAGRARQLLRGLVRLAGLGRARQLQGRHRRPRVPPVARSTTSSCCWPCRSCSASALAIALVLNDRIRGGEQVPGDHLPALRAAGDRDRHRVLVPAAGERGAQHRAARRAPRLARAGLARQLAPRDRLGRRARRLAAARLRRRRVHGGAARAPARDGGGGADRRRRLVEPAVPRARAADPPDHRAADRDPGDHGALVGLQLRLRAHLRAARATRRA